MTHVLTFYMFLFFNDTATTEIYTLSLHDALPIYAPSRTRRRAGGPRLRPEPDRRAAPDRRSTRRRAGGTRQRRPAQLDRKSTRLNSSHANISYAVFCLKKKKKKKLSRNEATSWIF